MTLCQWGIPVRGGSDTGHYQLLRKVAVGRLVSRPTGKPPYSIKSYSLWVGPPTVRIVVLLLMARSTSGAVTAQTFVEASVPRRSGSRRRSRRSSLGEPDDDKHPDP
jgi:cytochrome c-type biogenesis protein CcmH/NrfF